MALRPGESRDFDTLLKKKKQPKKKRPPKPPPQPPQAPNRVVAVDPRLSLSNVYIHGGRLSESLSTYVTGARLSWAVGQVTQMTLTFADPGFEVFREGVFKKGAAILYREPGFPDLNLRIASITVDGGPAGTGGFQIQCRSELIDRLKKRRGPKVMKKASPSEFVRSECKALKVACVVQPSPKRAQVARDVRNKKAKGSGGANAPSSWTTLNRFASELGFVIFEFGNVLYFGKPTWFIKRDTSPLQLALPLEGHPEVWATRTMPQITMSDDAQVPVTISGVSIERDRLTECRPGGAVQLRGLPPFNDLYMLDSLELNLLAHEGVQLSASTPENPKPQPPPKAKKKGKYDDDDSPNAGNPGKDGDGKPGSGGGDPGGKSGAAFVAAALKASGARYQYGAEASSSDSSPSALDCSELVQWALGRIGVSYVDGSSSQYAASRKITVSQAMGTKGALLWKEGHIGISMGDGRSVEARNPSAGVGVFRAADISWAGGGLVPGLNY